MTMGDMIERPSELALHRALAEAQRARILGELERGGDLDAHELARRLGLHANTIRWHARILIEAGLLSSRAAARDTPGRPRTLYSLGANVDASAAESYRLLATILTGTLSELADGAQRAARAGYAWGRSLVQESATGQRTSAAEDTQTVITLLAQEGFRPEESAREIKMHHCPFGGLATSGSGGLATSGSGEIACAVHRGLIAGALAELRSTLGLEQLDAFVAPDLCVARLGARRRVRPPKAAR
jgi:predicted ArsR family transcriptional regulator